MCCELKCQICGIIADDVKPVMSLVDLEQTGERISIPLCDACEQDAIEKSQSQ